MANVAVTSTGSFQAIDFASEVQLCAEIFTQTKALFEGVRPWHHRAGSGVLPQTREKLDDKTCAQWQAFLIEARAVLASLGQKSGLDLALPCTPERLKEVVEGESMHHLVSSVDEWDDYIFEGTDPKPEYLARLDVRQKLYQREVVLLFAPVLGKSFGNVQFFPGFLESVGKLQEHAQTRIIALGKTLGTTKASGSSASSSSTDKKDEKKDENKTESKTTTITS